MAFEMSCASCDGRMMVETAGVVVACPHCGTHLSIPAEIPGSGLIASKPPVSENDDSPDLDDDDDDDDDDEGDEEGPDANRSGNKSTWVPSFTEDDSSTSFPDLSNHTEAGASLSGSNILVSDAESESDDEVPSAVEVKNPDPSNVIPAIITDAPAPEPLSGFPVLDPPKAASKAESAGTQKAAEEEQADPTDLADTVEDFPGINLRGDAEPAAAVPAIATDAKPAEPEEGFPAVAEVTVSSASAPVIDTTPNSEAPQKDVKSKEKKPAASQAEATGDRKQSVYDAVFSSRRGKLVPNAVFQVWFSYTVLLTFIVIWLVVRLLTDTASKLESLPDVKPLRENVRKYVPESARMPPGHTLAFQETQRFGNIEVTPLKVTKGNVLIEGLDPDGPVLKLFVRFKNVSDDQTIVPLDEELLFDRNRDETRKAGAKANHFVCQAGEKREDGNLVLVYGRMIGIDYELKNQNLGTALEPGEEVTIYIPTETGRLEQLEGDLIWRVHFRKGYSPKNYGVTTVFEVKFHSDAIQADSANA